MVAEMMMSLVIPASRENPSCLNSINVLEHEYLRKYTNFLVANHDDVNANFLKLALNFSLWKWALNFSQDDKKPPQQAHNMGSRSFPQEGTSHTTKIYKGLL